MRQGGIDVVAYEPLELADNKYALREWTALLRDGHHAPKRHPDRALFLCWPSYDDPWAAHALACYEGDLLIYCGEPEGGCCADDDFFQLVDAEWDEAGSSPAHVSWWGHPLLPDRLPQEGIIMIEGVIGSKNDEWRARAGLGQPS